MAAYEQNIKGENIRLSNPGFAVEIHDSGASDPISSHDLESVRDKMKTRRAVSEKKRKELGQISTKSDTKKEVQAGVKKQ